MLFEADNRAGDTQPQSASMPKPVVQTPAQPSARAVGTGTRCYCTCPCGAKCLSPTCANPTGPGPMSAAGTAASCLTGPSAVPAASRSAPAPTTPSGYARAASCSAPRAISRPVRPFTSSPFSREGVRNRDVRNLRASRCNLSNRYSPLCRIRGNKPTAELRSMPRKALGDLCLRIR